MNSTNYPYVNREICGYCGACVSVCPASAIELIDLYLKIDKKACTRCLSCMKACPLGAMESESALLDKEEVEAIKPSSSQLFCTGSAKTLTKNKGKPEQRKLMNNPFIKSLSYDILVIGAGPAGSIAARIAAQNNMSVLIIEKRQEIGSPVRCAEGVSKRALSELVEIDSKWVCAEIDGGRIHAPDGSYVTIESPGSGLVLERKIFDRDLSAQAARAGAEVWVKSRAIGLIKENGRIAGAIVRRIDGDYSIQAKVVIAADGVESQAGRWAGIDTSCRPSEIDTCAQYLMKSISVNQKYCDFYLGNKIAPRGYAWIFPKGNDSANVGIGISGNIDTGKAIDYLNGFVEKEIGNGAILSLVAGCVPVAGVLSNIVLDGFMLVGDAAHQNDPVSGGGIINSMIAGQFAGEVASKSIKNGNTSRAALLEYENLWNKRVGRTFRHLRGIREGILKFNDETLNDIAKVLLKTRKISMLEMFWTALKNDPKLLLELRHLISMGWAQ